MINTFLEKIVSKLFELYLPKSDVISILSELFNFIKAVTSVRNKILGSEIDISKPILPVPSVSGKPLVPPEISNQLSPPSNDLKIPDPFPDPLKFQAFLGPYQRQLL